MRPIIKSGIVALLALIGILYVTPFCYAQAFNFRTIERDSLQTAEQIKIHGINDTIIVSHDAWDNMVSNSASWATNLKFKSVHDFVRLSVNHAYGPVKVMDPYTIRMTYKLYGFSNPAQPTTASASYNDTLTISYKPDSLATYQDKQFRKYSGFHKIMIVVTGFYRIDNASSIPVLLDLSPTSSFSWLNFTVEGAIVAQPYNKKVLNNGSYKEAYGTDAKLDIAPLTATNDNLPVYWQMFNTTLNPANTLPLNPVKYELEWTFIDNYKVTPSASGGMPSVSSLSQTDLTYDFTNNATRVILDTNYYKIPLIYQSGYLVYRVRMIRPDSINFQYPIYGPWTITNNSGIVSSVNANYKYYVSPHINDSLNWQYTVSFAEQGKYKHVMSYYDGMLKNRQSITRFNSLPNKLIATEQIYDYEGRPSISILPTPVTTGSFRYQPGLALNSNTNLPYRAQDFDTVQLTTCPAEIKLPKLSSSSLADVYYSSSNPDQSGFQKFVPDAGGFPLVQTIYSAGYDERVEKQGGAGDSLQIGYGHTVKNDYTGTEQTDLNRLFGTNIGWTGFYRKTVSKDPNGQLSLNITDYKGKTMMSSMIGLPDTAKLAIVSNSNLADTVQYTEDFLAGMPQQIAGNQRIVDKLFFNEAAGPSTAQYIAYVTPYVTFCPGKALSVEVNYRYSIMDECGLYVIDTAQTHGLLGVTGVVSPGTVTYSAPVVPFYMEKGKHNMNKVLTVNTDDIATAVDSFMSLPDAQTCMKDEPWFIKQEVLSKQFPCPEKFIDYDCPSCASKEYEMMKELFPNHDSMDTERKYGIYKIINGIVVGNDNSDFTLLCGSGLNPDGWTTEFPANVVEAGLYGGTEENPNLYPGGFSINNWTTPPMGIGGNVLPNGPYVILNNTDTLYCKYRYQDPCVVTMPDTVIKYGTVYTSLQQIPVADFIDIFNDSIAYALLPMHPEYCKLKDCVDGDAYPKQLNKIPDAKIAEDLDRLTLSQMIHADPIYTVMQAHPSLFPDPDSFLAYLPGNICIDTISFNEAYCRSTDGSMLENCQSDIFHDQIANGELVNPYVKERYFQSVRKLYIAARKRYLYVLKPSFPNGTPDCSICDSVRMTLVPDPVFPDNDSIGASLMDDFITSLSNSSPQTSSANNSTTALQEYFQNVQGAEMDTTMTVAVDSAIFGTDSMTIGPMAVLADSAVSGYIENANLIMTATLDSMMADFANCTPLGNLDIVRDYLQDLFTSGQVTNFTFTPQQVYAALQAGSINLDDLCNPYVVNYDGLITPSENTSGLVCGSVDYFNDVTSFLNASSLTSLQNPGTVYSVSLSGSNQLAQALATQLGGVSSCNVNCTFSSTEHVYTLTYTAGSLSVNIKIKAAAGSGTGLYPFTPASGETVSLVAQCYREIYSNFPAGYIGDFSFALTAIHTPSSGMPSSYKMKAWNDKIGMNDMRDNPISQSVPCTQFKKLYTQFADTLVTYNVKGTEHPYYRTMLRNFMNYKLQKVFTESQYLDFVESCALADSIFIKKFVGYHLRFVDSASAFAFKSALDSIADVEYRYIYIYPGDNSYSIALSLTHVSKNKLRLLDQFISNYPCQYHLSNFGYQDLQGNQWMGAIFVPFNTTINTATVFNNDPDGFFFVNSGDYQMWNGTSYELSTAYHIYTPLVNDISGNARKMKILQDYLHNNLATTAEIFGIEHPVNNEYYLPEKQSYLQYAYGFQNLPASNVLDTLQAANLNALVPVFSGKDLSYGHPANPGSLENLYIGDPATATAGTKYDKLTYITAKVGAYFNSIYSNTDNNILFAGANTRNITMPSGEMLTAYRCKDTAFWYRYFGQGDTLYNVFLRVPGYIDTTYFAGYKLVDYGYNLGEGASRSFWMKFSNPAAPISTMTINGYTDFTVANNKVLHNVLLTHEVNEEPADIDTVYNCERTVLNAAIYDGKLKYKLYTDSIRSKLYNDFYAYIMNQGISEKLLISYRNQRFNYTLYNYDRAGNLIQTIPPAGVAMLAASTSTTVNSYRTGNLGSYIPTYKKPSIYEYNSLNQVVEQKTPDGGETKFFYDAAGRVIFSQNDKQKPSGDMTYTLYDKQGRIMETGEAAIACSYFEPNKQNPAGNCYSFDPASRNYTPYPSVVFNLKNIDHQNVIDYVRSLTRSEVVYTNYDAPVEDLGAITGLSAQENLRKRVAAIKYFDFLQPTDSNALEYTYAMHFSYDISGNVKTLTRDYPLWKHTGQQYKRIDYDYDLISGKVNLLSYNRSFADQFYQKYSYDADNRITKVETSSDGYIWTRDAEYEYYQHGPLARLSLGDLRVQGVDYAYTIQGWLKSINSDLLNPEKDMGKDGDLNSGSIHANDGVALSLDYFKGDYKPIGTTPVTNLSMPVKNLYNGNIPRATTAITPFPDLASTYTYDQLNRIVKAAYADMQRTDTALNATMKYANSYAYDADGNLQKLMRNGDNNSVLHMDSLVYKYIANGSNNQLLNVNDYWADNYNNDIKYNVQNSVNRYLYDLTGNVVKDLVSGHDTIQWSHYNKVTLTSSDTAGGNMIFAYDGAGNRYIKSIEKFDGDTTYLKSEYNVRDAQGNILAIYNDDSKYGKDLESWIQVISYDVIGPCGHNFYINNVLAPLYGQNGYFRQSILTETYGNFPWAAAQLSAHPVSFYMLNNRSVMNNMMYGTVNYSSFFGKLAGYDNATGRHVMSDALYNYSKTNSIYPLMNGLIYRDPYIDENSSVFYTMASLAPQLSDSLLVYFGYGYGSVNDNADNLSGIAGNDPITFMNALVAMGDKNKFAVQYQSLMQAIFSPASTYLDVDGDNNDKPAFALLCEYAPSLLEQSIDVSGINESEMTLHDCDESTAMLLQETQNSLSNLINFITVLNGLGKGDYVDDYMRFLNSIFRNTGGGRIDDMQEHVVKVLSNAAPGLQGFVSQAMGIGYVQNDPDSNVAILMNYLHENPEEQEAYITHVTAFCDQYADSAWYRNLMDSITLDSTIMQYQYYACNDCIIYGMTSSGVLSEVFQDALNNYTSDSNKIHLAEFFDTWGPGKWLLRKSCDSATMLSILYDHDPGAYMDSYLAATSYDYSLLHNALLSIPHFSVNDMLHDMMCCIMPVPTCSQTVIDSIVHTQLVDGLKYRHLSLASHVLYGSSRLGTKDYPSAQLYNNWDNDGTNLVVDTVLNGRRPWYSLEYNDDIVGLEKEPWLNTDMSPYSLQHQIGQKQYELTNHLGNVQATISDLPYLAADGYDVGYITRKSPAMASAYDYYPFGMLMPGRYVSDTSNHCVTVTQTQWVAHDTTICYNVYNWRWPFTRIFGLAQAYEQSSELILDAPTLSDAIAVKINATPNLNQVLHLDLTVADRLTEDSRLVIEQQVNGEWQELASSNFDKGLNTLYFRPTSTDVRYRLAGPFYVKVGTECVTKQIMEQQSVLVDVCDEVKDRYRFGFNGQEKVNEWAGVGNFMEFSERGYDSRIGRFLRVDPITKKYPWLTPFQFAGNIPIKYLDLEGLEPGEPGYRAYMAGLSISNPKAAEIENEVIQSPEYHEGEGKGAIIGAAAFGILITPEVIPIMYRAFLFNPQLWTEVGISTLAGIAGYDGEIPGVGEIASITTKVTWTETKMTTYGTKLAYTEAKSVSLTMHEGASFATAAEKKMTQKLLSEGKNVEVLAESKLPGVKTADYLIDGIPTELKTISNIKSGDLSRSVKKTIESAISKGQARDFIIDVSDQQGATKELIQEVLSRVKGNNVNKSYNLRVIGKDFEFQTSNISN